MRTFSDRGDQIDDPDGRHGTPFADPNDLSSAGIQFGHAALRSWIGAGTFTIHASIAALRFEGFSHVRLRQRCLGFVLDTVSKNSASFPNDFFKLKLSA